MKETKDFLRAKPNTIQKNIVTLLDLEEKKTQYQNLLLRKVLLLKVCELKDRNTFPKVREGDSTAILHSWHL